MIVILDTIFQLISAFNYKESIYSWDMLLWFYVQVQDVKLRVGCKLMCTFNNIQVRCKSIIVNKTVYWLAPSKMTMQKIVVLPVSGGNYNLKFIYDNY